MACVTQPRAFLRFLGPVSPMSPSLFPCSNVPAIFFSMLLLHPDIIPPTPGLLPLALHFSDMPSRREAKAVDGL